MRTLCINEPQKIDLEKVFLAMYSTLAWCQYLEFAESELLCIIRDIFLRFCLLSLYSVRKVWRFLKIMVDLFYGCYAIVLQENCLNIVLFKISLTLLDLSCKCIVLTFDYPLMQVRIWLEEILWDKKYGMDVYRCKGVLSILDSDQLHTLQVWIHSDA